MLAKIFDSSNIFEEISIFEGLRRFFKIPKNLRLRLRSFFWTRRFFVFVFGPFLIFVATLVLFLVAIFWIWTLTRRYSDQILIMGSWTNQWKLYSVKIFMFQRFPFCQCPGSRIRRDFDGKFNFVKKYLHETIKVGYFTPLDKALIVGNTEALLDNLSVTCRKKNSLLYQSLSKRRKFLATLVKFEFPVHSFRGPWSRMLAKVILVDL